MYYFKGCRVIYQNGAVAAGCGKFGAIVGEFQVPNLIGVVTELERRPERETAFITQVIRVQGRRHCGVVI